MKPVQSKTKINLDVSSASLQATMSPRKPGFGSYSPRLIEEKPKALTGEKVTIESLKNIIKEKETKINRLS